MLKRISPADAPARLRAVVVTLDSHLAGAAERARPALAAEGVDLSLHVAAEWSDPAALDATLAAIAEADILVVTMLFMEDHIRAVLPALEARRADCDALVAVMCAGEVTRLTRMGRLDMARESGAMAFLKRLRGSGAKAKSSGEKQMKMLRRLPMILKYIPGTAQDLRAYFLTMQYWLACSDENFAGMIRYTVGALCERRAEAAPGDVAGRGAGRLSGDGPLSPGAAEPRHR